MSDPRITDLIEQALAYRGYVTVARRDGSQVIGFVYDRGAHHVEIYDESATNRQRLEIADITDVVLSGEDASAKAQRVWERRHGKLEEREASRWGEWEQCATLVLVALPIELRGVAAVIGGKIRGDTVRGKLGERDAIARAIGLGGGAAQAIAADRPRLVLSCGFCGALQPSLAAGSLVLASVVTDETGDALVPDPHVLRSARHVLRSVAPVAEGELLCATRVAATRDEKLALARPGRMAVDLESWGAARAATRAHIPWLALRVVVDPLDVALPGFARDPQRGYAGAALRHALAGPRSALDLVRVGLRANTAMRSLQRALGQLGPALDSLDGSG